MKNKKINLSEDDLPFFDTEAKNTSSSNSESQFDDENQFNSKDSSINDNGDNSESDYYDKEENGSQNKKNDKKQDGGAEENVIEFITDNLSPKLESVMEILKIITPKDVTKMSNIFGGSTKEPITQFFLNELQFGKTLNNSSWQEHFSRLWENQSTQKKNYNNDGLELPQIVDLAKFTPPSVADSSSSTSSSPSSTETPAPTELPLPTHPVADPPPIIPQEKTQQTSIPSYIDPPSNTTFFLLEKERMKRAEDIIRRNQYISNYQNRSQDLFKHAKKSPEVDTPPSTNHDGENNKDQNQSTGTLLDKKQK
ncbi:MAG: hypothetical protein HQK53_13270 [Oligoflexia bacterium]|nr:hypothetical protein [Oligoflexia bacterium]